MYLQNIKLSSVFKKLLYNNVVLWTYLHRNIEKVWNYSALYGHRWPKTLERLVSQFATVCRLSFVVVILC
jgi:hypothetical protein